MFLRVLHVLSLLLSSWLLKTTMALEWRVFEGEDLQYDVHSYLVNLQFRSKGGLRVSQCSGSIISASWIITAAHCADLNIHRVLVAHSTKDGPKLIAELNKHDVIRHPDFVTKENIDSNKANDIALLHLKKPIALDDHIIPMKLSTRRPKFGQTATIAGYGQSEDHVDPPREGDVVIARCPEYIVNAICTSGSTRAGNGDSGGPLIYKGALAGVISSGCKNVKINRMCLTVYSSAALHLNWINNVTKNAVEWQN